MKSTKISSLLNAALGLTLGALPFAAHAATLQANDTLTISPGVGTSLNNTWTGSWFSMDNNGDSKIQAGEKVALSTGTNGIVIGATTTAGTYHLGAPVGGDTGPVVASWPFFGSTGTNFNTVAITGDTVNGLNFIGWKVAWNNVASIDMGGSQAGGVAWTPVNAVLAGVPNVAYTNSKGIFSWDGVYGHSYTLDYATHVPSASANFPDVAYFLHLVGTVVSGNTVLASLTSPSGNAVNAATTNTIVVTFPEAVTTVLPSYISINGGAVAVNSVTQNGNIYTFNIGALANGTLYTVVFDNTKVTGAGGVAGLATSGKALAAVSNVQFTTSIPDVTPPTVTGTTPSTGISISPSSSSIIVTFSEAMDVATVTTNSLTTTPAITVSSVNAPTNGNKTFTFNISGLAASTNYSVSVKHQGQAGSPSDVAGNFIQNVAGNSWAFSTLSGANPVLSSVTNDRLLICPGSKFGMEVSPGNPIYTSITQKNPITIGAVQAATSANHSGAPTGSEPTIIDNAWGFFGSTGYHFTVAAITDNGNGTMGFSGWRVGWNNVPSINMGGGPAPAVFTWDGVYGHGYTLSYATLVPNGDPSGFGGVPYTLSLTGKVLGGPSNVIAACDGSVVTPSGATLSITGGGSIALNSQLRPDDTDVIAAGYSTAGRPDNLDFYKYGLITYTVTGLAQGATAQVKLTLPSVIPAGSKVYKVGTNGYVDITSQVTISGADVTLNIQDDGPLDTCKAAQGCTVGVIVDPIAVGTPIATGTSGAATGGSGGCAYTPNGKFDFGMLLALFGSLGYLGWRRTRQ